MPDIIDDANEKAEMYLQNALRQRKPEPRIPKMTGKCWFCFKKIPRPRRWCDADCRNDWEREQSRK